MSDNGNLKLVPSFLGKVYEIAGISIQTAHHFSVCNIHLLIKDLTYTSDHQFMVHMNFRKR
jgi:hypothetical protein